MALSQMKNCATHVTAHLPVELMNTYSKSGIANSISVKNRINFFLAFLNMLVFIGNGSANSKLVNI